MDILTTSHERSILTVTLHGRLDALEAGPLRSHLCDAIAEGQIRIVVDLSQVQFVDSAGLAALVKGMKNAREAGGDLKLVRPASANAMRVFELTKFDQVFDMAPDAGQLVEGW